jgi:hypothetical protein
MLSFYFAVFFDDRRLNVPEAENCASNIVRLSNLREHHNAVLQCFANLALYTAALAPAPLGVSADQ